MTDVLDFWLEKGVDGFRVDAVPFIGEAVHLRNEPVNVEKFPDYKNMENYIDNVFCVSENSEESDLYHDYTLFQGLMHDVLEEFRGKLLEFSTEPGVDKVMITEAVGITAEESVRFYGTGQALESSFPFNFRLLEYSLKASETDSWDGTEVANEINSWLGAANGLPTYTVVFVKCRFWCTNQFLGQNWAI